VFVIVYIECNKNTVKHDRICVFCNKFE